MLRLKRLTPHRTGSVLRSQLGHQHYSMARRVLRGGMRLGRGTHTRDLLPGQASWWTLPSCMR